MINITNHQRSANQNPSETYLPPVRKAVIRGLQIAGVGKGGEERGPSCTVGGG